MISEEQILPRFIRRAYQSKNKRRIERVLVKAIQLGFTKQEIREDFNRWKQENLDLTEGINRGQ